MVQTTAERENNGHHLIADWKLDMVHFWNNNHNKYLILGHRLLTGNYMNNHNLTEIRLDVILSMLKLYCIFQELMDGFQRELEMKLSGTAQRIFWENPAITLP